MVLPYRISLSFVLSLFDITMSLQAQATPTPTEFTPEHFQALINQVQQLASQLGNVEGNILIQGDKNVEELETKVDELHEKMERTVVHLRQELHAFVNTPPAPPQVIHVSVPTTHGERRGDSKRYGRSIMDTKGFTKMDSFKGLGW